MKLSLSANKHSYADFFLKMNVWKSNKEMFMRRLAKRIMNKARRVDSYKYTVKELNDYLEEKYE